MSSSIPPARRVCSVTVFMFAQRLCTRADSRARTSSSRWARVSASSSRTFQLRSGAAKISPAASSSTASGGSASGVVAAAARRSAASEVNLAVITSAKSRARPPVNRVTARVVTPARAATIGSLVPP